MSGHIVLGRFFWLGMLTGNMGLALLGRMRGSRFGRVRMMPGDVRMGDLGWDQPGRQSQRSRKCQQLPDHVILFGKELPGL